MLGNVFPKICANMALLFENKAVRAANNRSAGQFLKNKKNLSDKVGVLNRSAYLCERKKKPRLLSSVG